MPFVVAALPAEVEMLFSQLMFQLAQLGFLEPVFHTIYDPGSSTTLYWATFRHSSGQHMARVHHRVWGKAASAAARQPLYSVSRDSVQEYATAPGDLPAARHLIVATFKKPANVIQAFQDFTNNLPENSRLARYGQTLLLSIPAGEDNLREKWFDSMHARSTNLFVRVSNAPVSLSLTFVAPNGSAASNLLEEVGAYLHASASMHLVAPWAPGARDIKYADYRKARVGWRRIDQELSCVYTQADYRAYGTRMTAALKRGSMAEVARLNKEQDQAGKELRAALLQKLSADGSGIAADLATLYGKLDRLSFTNRVERQKIYREVAALLGEVPYAENQPEPKADAYSASGGTISVHGLLCEVRYANFRDLQGLLTFTEWLCDKGCMAMKYEIRPGWISFEEGLDESDETL